MRGGGARRSVLGATTAAMAAVMAAGCTCGSALEEIRTVQAAGLPRPYLLHVPAACRGERPCALVLSFHGFGSSGHEQKRLTGLDAKADWKGFIAAYPEGMGIAQSFNGGACCGEAAQRGADDVALAAAVIDDVQARFKVDSKRVFAMGMSNGGFMAHRLACALADRVAAVASVAGTLGIATCAPSRPVSVLEIHGTADPLVPFKGGGGLSAFGGIEAAMRGWAARDRCRESGDGGGERKVVHRRGEATCESFGPCDGGADVVLCRVEGGGHTWPGGPDVPRLGRTSGDLDATDYAWRFFEEHPMP